MTQHDVSGISPSLPSRTDQGIQKQLIKGEAVVSLVTAEWVAPAERRLMAVKRGRLCGQMTPE